LPENPYLALFYEKYSEAFCMSSCRGNDSPYEAPTKPLRSQEQEQEKEQEQEQKKGGADAPELSALGPDGQGSAAEPGQAEGAGAAAPAAEPGKDTDRLPRALGVRELVAEGVERKHAEDWLKVRSAKRAPLTPTAWDDVKAEAAKAGITPADAVRISAMNSWQGFKATWCAKLGQEGSAAGGPAATGTHGGYENRNYGQGGAL
jgi:hypothetical protein